jgi:hypothetical protein
MMSDIAQRIVALEQQAHRQSPAPSPARKRMREHLDRLVSLRRGKLFEDEAAEVRATHATIEHRMAEIRGEGAIADG